MPDPPCHTAVSDGVVSETLGTAGLERREWVTDQYHCKCRNCLTEQRGEGIRLARGRGGRIRLRGQADSGRLGTRPTEVPLQPTQQHLICLTISQKAGHICTCFSLQISWHVPYFVSSVVYRSQFCVKISLHVF